MRLFTRARSRIVEQAERPLRFGGPDGAVVRRDVWRSDGVLRDGYCDSCWSDCKTPARQNAIKERHIARAKLTHNCIYKFACSIY